MGSRAPGCADGHGQPVVVGARARLSGLPLGATGTRSIDWIVRGTDASPSAREVAGGR